MTMTVYTGLSYIASGSNNSPTGGITSLRTVLGNGNVLPYTFNTAASIRFRSYAKKKQVASNANYSQVKVTWSNFVATSTNESAAIYPTQKVAHSIKYNGVYYPVTYSGASSATVASGTSVTSDTIAGLTLTAGSEYEERGLIIYPLPFKNQTANFTVGQVVTGGTSGATGTIESQTDAGATGSLVLINESGTFVDGEALTDPLGGAAVVDLASNINYINSITTLSFFLEGTINSNTATTGYLAADPVTTRMVPGAVTINGSGNITAIATSVAGVGYSSASSVTAYEYHDGTFYFKNVGNTNVGHTSITITSGTPPAGLAAWTNPTIVITGGGDFGATTAINTCSLTTGIPSVPVKSILLIGDSITRGYSSVDALGDLTHNFGIHERAILNRCGTINSAISSLTAANFADYSTKFPKTYALYIQSGICTHARIALGINDITTGVSQSALKNNLNVIRDQCTIVGMRTAFSKYMPCVTTTDGCVTEVNQTPKTGCSAGGVLDLMNIDIVNNTLVSDFAVSDPYTIVRGDDPNKWNSPASSVPVTAALSGDGTHPGAYFGIAYISLNSTFQSGYDAIA